MILCQKSSFAIKLLAVIVTANIVRADEEFSEPVHLRKGRVRRQTTDIQGFFNRTLRIATIHQEPYCTVTRSGSSDTYTYTGFIPDFIAALSKRLYFTYSFYHVDAFGRYNQDTKTWNGLIGEVIINDESGGTRGADIAAAALTITSGRERVVDFLKPFQHSGISAIIRRPDYSTEKPFTFSIFQPLQPALWGLILLSALVVGLFLWVMNMYNPYEWSARHGLGLADNHLAELFSLPGSIWFVFSSLQWQGFERAPRSIASKFLGSVWFVFVTLVLITYTAGIVNNLYWASTAHQTLRSPLRPRYVDLPHAISSGAFKYGTVNNTQTYRYLMDVAVGEEFDVIRNYWKTAEGQAQLIASTDEGLKKVRDPNSDYIFLMESLAAKYLTKKRPCDLVAIGEPIGARSYGFAIPTKMPFSWSDELHRATLEMMEEGDIEDLERRWFSGGGECWNVTMADRVISDVQSSMDTNQPRSIDVSTFIGPLVMILVGLVVSIGIAAAEVIYYRKYGRFQSGNRLQVQQLAMDPSEGNV